MLELKSSFSKGGQVDGIILALIESVLDKQDNVSRTITNSLCTIGKHQPNLVLSYCSLYLQKDSKLPFAHKISLYSVMEKVCKDSTEKLDKELVVSVCKTTIEEMTLVKEVTQDKQKAFAGLMVALGHQYHDEVMDHLHNKLQPGTVPHLLILETLANLAVANPFGIVPYLKALLGTMLPMLGMAKPDQTKWTMAYALGKFCEAILEYMVNLEKAPDPTVKKHFFESEIASAYEFLLLNWLQSREARVRSETAATLGYMSHILSVEKLEEQSPKAVSSIISLYRKHQDCYPLTQGLCLILEAEVHNRCSTLETQLDSILNAIFLQICNPPDYSQPGGVRNHNEALRCFTVLAPLFADRLVTFLVLRVDNSNERVRIGALTALKHLINSSDAHLADKMRSITLGLRVALGDHSNKVKKVLAQVIVALAHHGYLETDGGQSMIEFLIRQCALPDDSAKISEGNLLLESSIALGLRNLAKRPPDPDYVSNEALRCMCENVLQLLTTTVDRIEKVLWPYLFEYILSEDLTASVGVICKCLGTFAAKKREEQSPDLEIDYQKHPSLPKPQALFARLVVLLGNPFAHQNKGLHIIKLLRAIPSLVHKGLTALWDAELPQMAHRLEEYENDTESFDIGDWKETIVSFCNKCFLEVDKEDWAILIGNAMLSQLPLYNSYPDDKCLLLQLLGVVMKKVGNKQFIDHTLDRIFEYVNHSHPGERKGCAIGVGYCGATHLDTVLVKLEQVAKDDLKRSSGLLSFLKDFTGDSYHEKLKATIILCYGYVSLQAPASILTTRVETPILRSSAKFYQSSKELCVRQAMLQTVKMVADAVHFNHLKEKYEFRSRMELVMQMQATLKSENPHVITTTVRALALSALASLVALDPPLSDDEKVSLINTAVASVYSLPPKAISPTLKEEPVEEVIEYALLLQSSLESLDHFLNQLLLKEKSPDNLKLIIKTLRPWFTSKNESERERCLNTVWQLMSIYSKNIEIGVFQSFSSLGYVLGMLCPRCTDPSPSIRSTALKCIQFALEISNKSQSLSCENDVSIQNVEELHSKIEDSDSDSLFAITQELAKIIAKRLQSEQLISFVESIVYGLVDPLAMSSSGASVVLGGVIKLRGGELRTEVPNIVENLRTQLGSITCPRTKTGSLHVIRTLAKHHLTTVINALLAAPLPFDEQTSDCWKALAKDVELGSSILSHLLENLSEISAYEPKPDPRNSKNTVKVASIQVLSAVCALQEIFRVVEMEGCAKEQFGPVFSAFLLASANYIGVHVLSSSFSEDLSLMRAEKGAGDRGNAFKLVPVRCSLDSFKSFLLCGKQDAVLNSMSEEGHWVNMENEKLFPTAVAALGRLICTHCHQQIPSIVTCLHASLASPNENQRTSIIALFAEFMSQTYPGSHTLTEPLMNDILSRLGDPCSVVRRLCIKGLSSISLMEKEMIHRYSSTVLSAMMAGMDDKDDTEYDITLEAVNGLSTVLGEVDEHSIRSIVVTISLRLRPMFEKEKGEVRAAAFRLLGDLAKFAEGPAKDQLVEQSLNNFITLLLHLNEEDKQVVKSCKHALKQLGPILGSENVNTMFQKHLLDDATLHYGEFINDLTKVVVSDFSDNTVNFVTSAVSYLRSSRPSIQCNAALLLGFLLGNLPKERHKDISADRICSALIVLLKDSTPEVRMRAAEALSFLYRY